MAMRNRILHVLSQRPGRTGSGVTLDAVVEQAGRAGWDQAAVIGIPAGETPPLVGNLDPTAVFPVRFRGPRPGGPPGDLDFPVPGMSDVMPYPSSVWSALTAGQLDDYRRVWTAHLQDAIDRFRPHLIHTNHLWLVSALVRRAAPDLPVVATCHATGLRQRELCPHLAEEVAHGCRRIDRFCVLRDDHRWQLARTLAVGPDRITVTGAGYRDDLFHPGRTPADPDQVLYVGKFSAAKGLPWLLDAVEAL
ncbi:glycosyltransferase, partial [bacterium]|nr:glycosyltransferase [bacterium]